MKLNILNDVLLKKEAALDTILAISENQAVVLGAPPSSERAAMFNAMNDEKNARIDEVLQCDEVFQTTYDSLAKPLESADKTPYAEQLSRLKAGINAVLERDTAIRAQEARNRATLEEQKAAMTRGEKAAKKPAAAPPPEGYIKNYGKKNAPPNSRLDKRV